MIRNLLSKNGFSEVYTYGLSDTGYFEIVKSASDKNFVREGLLPNLSRVVENNIPNTPLLGVDNVQIFEIGNVFPKTGEKTELGIAVYDIQSKGKKNSEKLKQSISLVSETVGISIDAYTKIKDNVASVDFDTLLENLSEPKEYDLSRVESQFVYKKISIYPFVLRDIAVWVPENVSEKELSSVIQNMAGELLVRSPRLVDEYKKDGRVSYAFRLVFQSYEKTLTDTEVNAIMEKIYVALKERGWEVR